LEAALERKEEESDKLKEANQEKDIEETTKVADLQNMLDEKETKMKRTIDENMQLQKDKKVEIENIQKKDVEIENLTCAISNIQNEVKHENIKQDEKYVTLEIELKKYLEEINSQKEELQICNSLLSKAKETVDEKDKEILQLKDIADKDQTEIKDHCEIFIVIYCRDLFLFFYCSLNIFTPLTYFFLYNFPFVSSLLDFSMTGERRSLQRIRKPNNRRR